MTKRVTISCRFYALLPCLFMLTLLFFSFDNSLAQTVSPPDSTRQEVSTPYTPEKGGPVKFKQPISITEYVDYDPASGEYIIKKKIGDQLLDVPYGMTPSEYSDYRMKKSLEAYWRARNLDTTSNNKTSNSWLLRTLNNTIPGIGDIFGGAAISVSAQAAVELRLGLKRSFIDNPTIPVHLRTLTNIDFEENIRASVHGQLGNSIKLGIDYNTQATFDFDTRVNLRYEGDEDEIIKVIEAGNVSLPLPGTLIQGSQSLMGIKSVLQFGRLTVSSVFSQQKTESQTLSFESGAQKTSFEIHADQYDANRHFFLSHFFRDSYEKTVSQMPFINSGIKITRIEVWVTNRQGRFNQARNILGLADLGEPERIFNNRWTSSSAHPFADNQANDQYATITRSYPQIREIGQVGQVLSDPSLRMRAGKDYDKIESARLLETSEYVLNDQLGYISLMTPLANDEILSVAYEYTYRGKVYRVGELSSGEIQAPHTLVTKLLKGTALSPAMPFWDLMMKNVYYVGANRLETTDFTLRIAYEDDETGADLQVLPVGNIQNTPLLSVMELDQRNSQNDRFPDGYFDHIEHVTINSTYGRIIFPVLEPFGSHLEQKIGSPEAEKYVFRELYDTTLLAAKQVAEKNKFKLFGHYRSSGGSEIFLNTINLAEGSVKVMAGGVKLTENIDYTVDYALGRVTILDQGLLESGTTINVSLESQALFNMQQKTLLGTHLDYQFSPDFNIGGTVMHMYERPFTEKVSVGSEPIANTIWGLNTSYRTTSQSLTNWLDRLPLLNLKEESSLAVNAEIAQLIPGVSKTTGDQQGMAYLDDFEATKIGINLKNVLPWQMASVPQGQQHLFPEAELYDDVNLGKNRALLAWYHIDPLFNRSLSSTPGHINDDLAMRSNHYTREIKETEIWKNRQQAYGDPLYISTLDLAFYPLERGPYNYDVEPGIYSKGMDNQGNLKAPETRWAGITRQINSSDFETNNIEHIEFWILDPFIYNPTDSEAGGELYFNLGDISEDLLKDGAKFYENGLPLGPIQNTVDTSNWGLIPTQQALNNAFSNEAGARAKQDLGYDGLNDAQEKLFLNDYLNRLTTYLPAYASSQSAANNRHSPINDPAGDNYHYFRGSDYDRDKVSILERYKYINNSQGNSPTGENSPESYPTAISNLPNSEDINNDNTLNEIENYYQYKINLRPSQMEVGKNYITDRVEAEVTLPNGKTETVSWYQFKIPVHKPEEVIGEINDFKSIRFMRIFLRNFKKETVLRFGSLELVRSDWRIYDEPLHEIGSTAQVQPNIDITAVNIEENADRTPVNYVLPPGIARSADPNQTQLRELNEQALSLRVLDLAPQNANAVYKTLQMDMRRYKRMQLYVHAESIGNEILLDRDLTAFIRIGSDFQDNYYEYEIPLKLTEPGYYDQATGREKVWPVENFFDVEFSKFHNLKLHRNSAKNKAGANISYATPYTELDPDKPTNRITVKGNPNTAEVKTIMIGVRNRAGQTRSIEVWVNELRLVDFEKDGGWAGNASAIMRLSDLGSVSIGGMFETAGFGGLEQALHQRAQEDYHEYNIATDLQLGKLVSNKGKVQLPTYFSYSKAVTTPKYNPLDPDIELKKALDAASPRERDSIESLSITEESRKSFNISNARVNITSKTPMPYDPGNFSVSYSYVESDRHSPEVQKELSKSFSGTLHYNYSPKVKPVEPFKSIKWKAMNSASLKLIRDFNFNYLPRNISFRTSMHRQYNEFQLRDFSGSANGLPAQVRREFYWDREFNLDYDLTKALQVRFSTRNNAIIDEPYKINGQDYRINKNLYPDEYEVWKDSVWRNIKNLGRTTDYNQNLSISYKLPLDKLPLLDWVQSHASYASSYSWLTAPNLNIQQPEQDTINTGNRIENSNSMVLDTRLDLNSLYNKVGFLKKINHNAASEKSKSQRTSNEQRIRKYESVIDAKKQQNKVIVHNLNNTKVKVNAYDEDDKPIGVKYQVKDENRIIINPVKDLEQARLVISTQGTTEAKESKNILAEIGKATLKVAMGFKNIDISYRENNASALAGFMPGTGFLGQSNGGGIKSPGYGFAFGMQDRKFGRKAAENGWLTKDIDLAQPYYMSHQNEFTLRSSFKPFKDFSIEFNASRVYSNSHSEYLQLQAPYYTTPFETGSITMTYIGLASSFWKMGSSGQYDSEFLDRFIENRMIFAQRLATQKEQAGVRYPSSGEFAGQGYAGQAYRAHVNPDGSRNEQGTSGINLNSADVAIPAFLATIGNKNARSASSKVLPTIKAMLPNWRMTYNGLSKVNFIKQHFNNINITHAYQCTYTINSYATNPSYYEYNDGFGFVQDADGNQTTVFLSKYDVPTVTLVEEFNPLFRIDAIMKNNFMFNVGLRRSRALTLNIPSNQLLESIDKQTTIGLGYRLNDFDIFLGRAGISKFKNDLTLKGDISFKDIQLFTRRIDEYYSQPDQGVKTKTLSFTADYVLTDRINIRLYYDRVLKDQMISTYYNTMNSSFGISFRFTLIQ